MTSDRITRANLDERVENLNRRMEQRGSMYRYVVEGRYGYIGLDRAYVDGSIVSTVRTGTKREIGEFLHAMMVALDDASYVEEHAAAR